MKARFLCWCFGHKWVRQLTLEAQGRFTHLGENREQAKESLRQVGRLT